MKQAKPLMVATWTYRFAPYLDGRPEDECAIELIKTPGEDSSEVSEPTPPLEPYFETGETKLIYIVGHGRCKCLLQWLYDEGEFHLPKPAPGLEWTTDTEGEGAAADEPRQTTASSTSSGMDKLINRVYGIGEPSKIKAKVSFNFILRNFHCCHFFKIL
jgi:hypothetical protein